MNAALIVCYPYVIVLDNLNQMKGNFKIMPSKCTVIEKTLYLETELEPCILTIRVSVLFTPLCSQAYI